MSNLEIIVCSTFLIGVIVYYLFKSLGIYRILTITEYPIPAVAFIPLFRMSALMSTWDDGNGEVSFLGTPIKLIWCKLTPFIAFAVAMIPSIGCCLMLIVSAVGYTPVLCSLFAELDDVDEFEAVAKGAICAIVPFALPMECLKYKKEWYVCD